MVRTQIQLTREQYQAVKAIAASGNTSSAEVIRQAVDELVRSRSVVDQSRKRSRALRVVGLFKSGKTDVSKNHDAYLARDCRTSYDRRGCAAGRFQTEAQPGRLHQF